MSIETTPARQLVEPDFFSGPGWEMVVVDGQKVPRAAFYWHGIEGKTLADLALFLKKDVEWVQGAMAHPLLRESYEAGRNFHDRDMGGFSDSVLNQEVIRYRKKYFNWTSRGRGRIESLEEIGRAYFPGFRDFDHFDRKLGRYAPDITPGLSGIILNFAKVGFYETLPGELEVHTDSIKRVLLGPQLKLSAESRTEIWNTFEESLTELRGKLEIIGRKHKTKAEKEAGKSKKEKAFPKDSGPLTPALTRRQHAKAWGYDSAKSAARVFRRVWGNGVPASGKIRRLYVEAVYPWVQTFRQNQAKYKGDWRIPAIPSDILAMYSDPESWQGKPLPSSPQTEPQG